MYPDFCGPIGAIFLHMLPGVAPQSAKARTEQRYAEFKAAREQRELASISLKAKQLPGKKELKAQREAVCKTVVKPCGKGETPGKNCGLGFCIDPIKGRTSPLG